MIPKVIHYYWFGGKKTALARKCIASWRRFAPNFKLQEWNETNVDVSVSKFAADAFAARKWGFVPDPLRMRKIYEEGGVYLDTDVELIRPIDDLVERGPFFGVENDNPWTIGPGLGFAAEKGDPVIKAIAEAYNEIEFSADFNSAKTGPAVVSEVLKRVDASHFTFYPPDWFNPLHSCDRRIPEITANTRAIHHYAASWFGWRQQLAYRILPRMGIHIHPLVMFVRRMLGK